MKKTLLSLTVGICSMFTAQAEEKEKVQQSFGYFNYGFGLPELIDANVGYRFQRNHQGFDIGVGVNPLVFVYGAHAYANYLIYPSPSKDGQAYIGLGVYGGTFDHHRKKFSDFEPHNVASAAFTLGKEFQRNETDKRFVQVSVLPVSYAKEKFRFAPAIKVSYGFGF